ncbi:MAG: pilus assembly protein N-terminal domain-containing protein [Planctomycetota bacterium]|nr:pilus assembly protein N-terminal domain-containing protein [Planctomycetota bacterium]
MNSATDGQEHDGVSGARRRRPRRISNVTKYACLIAAVVLIPQASAPPEVAVGQGQTSLVGTSVRVVANRAMSIFEPAASRLQTRGFTAANRPASITRDFETTDSGSATVEDLLVFQSRDAESAVAPPVDAAVVSSPSPSAGSSPGSFILSIGPSRSPSRQIVVSRNDSAVINLAVKIDRAEVLNPNIAGVLVESPIRVVVTGLDIGVTQLVLRSGQVQRVIEVIVELDLSRLRELITFVAPTARVTARSVQGVIVLTGTAPSHAAVRRIIDMARLIQGGEVNSQIDVAGVQQTMLRVVVAEVNKTASRQLGVNWAIGASDLSRNFFFANNLNQLNPTVFASSGLANVLQGQQLYSVGAVGNGVNTNVTFGFPKAEFQMFITALRENNLFRILAEPNLVALNGQTATFLAGGEVPIPVAQGGAVAGAIVIEYKEFGVRLAFTPSILSGQRLRIHVMTEISDAIPGTQIVGGLPVFSFTTRRVESTIECGNGQTFAIAGLLRDTIQAVASKIPGFGDLPILGALFSSVDYQRSNTELVVLVTPQYVEPLEPHQVAPPPGSLMTEPNDYELFGLQKLEGVPHPRPEHDGVPRDTLPVNTVPVAQAWPTTRLMLQGPLGLSDYTEK